MNWRAMRAFWRPAGARGRVGHGGRWAQTPGGFNGKRLGERPAQVGTPTLARVRRTPAEARCCGKKKPRSPEQWQAGHGAEGARNSRRSRRRSVLRSIALWPPRPRDGPDQRAAEAAASRARRHRGRARRGRRRGGVPGEEAAASPCARPAPRSTRAPTRSLGVSARRRSRMRRPAMAPTEARGAGASMGRQRRSAAGTPGLPRGIDTRGWWRGPPTRRWTGSRRPRAIRAAGVLLRRHARGGRRCPRCRSRPGRRRGRHRRVRASARAIRRRPRPRAPAVHLRRWASRRPSRPRLGEQATAAG